MCHKSPRAALMCRAMPFMYATQQSTPMIPYNPGECRMHQRRRAIELGNSCANEPRSEAGLGQ